MKIVPCYDNSALPDVIEADLNHRISQSFARENVFGAHIKSVRYYFIN